MKKTMIFSVLLFMLANLQAQLVEHYENPQRFEFSGFNNHNLIDSYGNYGFVVDEYDGNLFLSRKYTLESHRFIYGVAIPLNTRDLDTIPATQYVSDNRFRDVINFYETMGSSVIIGNATHVPGYEYELLSTAHIRIGESALIGNYFKMPDSDSSILRTIVHNTTYFPVIEVYFDQPQLVSANYIVGCNMTSDEPIVNGHFIYLYCGPLYLYGLNENMNVKGALARITNDSYINTSITGEILIIDENSWGAPFPIVTPPPCMPPIRMAVKAQHRQGATIEWRAQYANTMFEVEYGPQGFAEGTGATVDSIMPDANFFGRVTLSGLQMDADYTVRVRSYCEIAGGYSDWTEMDFHTDQYYLVSTSVNDDSCGYIKGDGWYIADTTIRLYAYPKNYSPFLNWSDGSTQNPRIVTVTCDTSFHAEFQCSGNGDSTEAIVFVDMHKASPYIHPNPTDGIITVRSTAPSPHGHSLTCREKL